MNYAGKFPKIWALGSRNVSQIFDDEVEITEKVDGSQFGFGKINGELVCRSRNKQLILDAPDKLFTKAVERIQNIVDLLPSGVIFYAEYLSKPKHNTLKYDRVPKNNLALFGIYDQDQDIFIGSYKELAECADLFGIDVTPLIYSGKATPEMCVDLIQRESFLGGPNIEGVVVKNYDRQLMIGDQCFPIICAKYVSEKFKEVHQRKWKKENTGKGKFETYREQFCNEARWEKAVQHLAEAGKRECDPRDIGALIKNVQKDIIDECKEDIKEVLWKIYGNDILRTAIRGLPEWYKAKLIDENFNKVA